jgi:hypothetical protein
MTALLHFGEFMDIPEILIIIGIVGGCAWAVYNWTHRVQH